MHTLLFTDNSNSEKFDDNSFDLSQECSKSSISPSFIPNNLLNDSISLSSNQYNQEHDSFNFAKVKCYNPNDFLTLQRLDFILEENNDIDKDINTVKEKERKEEDNQNINNNNDDHNNNNKTEKEKPRKHDKIDKDINTIKEKDAKEEDKHNINNNVLGKKRNKKHDKTAIDNIKRKIQVNYIKFLRNLLNQINNELLGNYENNKNIQFFPLNSYFMKLISSKFFDELKEQTLGDIFKNNVSHKYKNYQNLNIQVYNEITDKSETLKKILDKKYLEFFDVYYLNKKKLNLSKYGSNKTIILSSNIEFFKDLLKKDDSDSDYQKRIEKCIKSYFIPNDKPIFFVE